MGERCPTVILVDNREYRLVREGYNAFLERHMDDDVVSIGDAKPPQRTSVAGWGWDKRARWDQPRCWDVVRKFVSEAKASSDKSHIFILRKDGYSHDTEDDYLSVGFAPQGFSVHTGNLVGSIVSRGKKEGEAVGRIAIGSRFGDSFLQYIISDADGFLAIENGGGDEESVVGYDWLLGYLWNIKFKNAYRLGLPKCYTTRLETIAAPRGNIDTLGYYEYAKRGRVGCEYRDFTYNNPAASLFALTWKVLNGRPSS